MLLKGRPRLTEDDLKGRIKTYCKSYGASLNDQGLPEFPAGKRETAQHREWISLYKLWNRLGRRRRGQCERCQERTADGSIFCETHKAESARATEPRASLDERRAALTAQKGRCPICAETVDLLESVSQPSADGETPALLHASCGRLAKQAAQLGKEGVERLASYLWPKGRKPRS
jgi:hypothetical protein